MTTPFPFTSGQTLTAAQMNAITTLPTTTKVASHTLVIADQGTRVIMNSASATTITVNTSIFGASDIVEIHNIGAGVCTVTAGTCTVSSAGPLAIPQFGGGQLFFTSAGVSIFFPTAVTVSASPTSRIWLNTYSGYGSSSTAIPRFTTTVVNSGSDITYADSASLGSTFTINTAGMYAMSIIFPSALGGSAETGISLNSAELTTRTITLNKATRLGFQYIPGISGDVISAQACSTFYLAVNDVIRPHNNPGQVPNDVNRASFQIVRLN